MMMKKKLSKSVMFFLLVTVLGPIVLYTDNLGVYFTPSFRNEFLEDASAFAFGGEIRALNVLPQESTTAFEEPLGVVYPENSTANYLDESAGENARFTRQLTEELEGDVTANSSSLAGGNGGGRVLDENPLRQVVNKARGAEVGAGNANLSIIRLSVEESNVKEENRSLHFEGASRIASEKKEVVSVKKSSRRRRGNSGSREQQKAGTEKLDVRAGLADSRVLQLKDLLIQGKVYLSLLATRNNPHYMRELRLRMREAQRALGTATKDSELPKKVPEKMKAMEETLAKGKQIVDDPAASLKKLRAMIHSAEEQLEAQKTQSMFLTQLAAKTIPKGLHCLPLRLSTDYFMLNSSDQQIPDKQKLEDPKLFHYALFSDNILAAAVVVNSTITHTKDPSRHVFHVVTDRLNYAAMRMWFIANPPNEATIQVQNIEEFTWLNSSYSPVLKQLGMRSMIDYYFKSRRSEPDSNLKYRNPKYLSIMNHLRFYLPEIFPNLNKVLFLDDDVVVQKDLTALWSLDLKGKVIGVVETCRERFHRYDHYLNFSNPIISSTFDPRSCGWAFGMNIFDLDAWRKQNITEAYHRWQDLNEDRLLWKLGTLPPGLITFWNHTFVLDKYWHVLGLGYNPSVSLKDIERAAVIHYNGNLKPWLEIGMQKFRSYWSKYVNYEQLYLRECNITP